MTAAFSGKLSTANGCTSDGKRYVTCWFFGALVCAEIRVVIAHDVKWKFDERQEKTLHSVKIRDRLLAIRSLFPEALPVVD